MIVVIADDLSGAAELANAALDAGLSADVQLRLDGNAGADVLCISTESRSLSATDAAARVGILAAAVREMEPDLVYKKCDSLLRGHVTAEADAAACALGLDVIVIVPANPSRRRIIRSGNYYVAGVPLADSPFAADPEYPRTTSRVSELLASAPNMVVPDTAFALDVSSHAHSLRAHTLPVGGVDFFAALLRRFIHGRPRASMRAGMPAAKTSLLVCGSRAAASARLAECIERRVPVFTLSQMARDVTVAADQLERRRTICVMPDAADGNPREILDELAFVAQQILSRVSADRVLLEGGATAAAVVDALGFQQFHARPSPGAGVGSLIPVSRGGQHFLVKPGSYPWPETAWTLASSAALPVRADA